MKYNKKSGNTAANVKTFILCLMFAVMVYATVYFAGQHERAVTMPLEIKMPEGFKATSLLPDKAEVRIRGSEKQIYMVDVSKIKLYADFSNVAGEGVFTSPVWIDYSDLLDYIDTSDVSIFTKPSVVKIYFK